MPRIRHLAIPTEDVERLVRFYTTAFGLKIVQGVGTATYLFDVHINLAIIPIGPERKIDGPDLKPGLYHFSFEVEDVAPLGDLCKELNAATGIDASTGAPARAGGSCSGSRPTGALEGAQACPWGSTAIPSISRGMAGRSDGDQGLFATSFDRAASGA